MKKSLLVQPNFPTSNKSKNHNNFLPIGLLKLATYLRKCKKETIEPDQLVWGEQSVSFVPKTIYITSIFTYWAEYVERSIKHYQKLFPKAKIFIGGIFASLMPEYCKSLGKNIQVFQGIHKEAEKISLEYGPAYDLVDSYGVDYQIIHGMRGCIRKCKFCGVWKIEKFCSIDVDKLINNIVISGRKGIIGNKGRNKLVFYDNNLFANENIEILLEKLAKLKINGRNISCECQSGFDGRILIKKPYLAKMLFNAHFKVPRIAWDHFYEDYPKIKSQIDLLKRAAYNSKEIFIFFIYNWDIPYEKMYKKIKKLWHWKVQISDCRNRPLNQTHDHYNPHMWNFGQTNEDYYIHPNWSDLKIRALRKLVRWHNISIRHLGYQKYNEVYEKLIKELHPDKIELLEANPTFSNLFSE